MSQSVFNTSSQQDDLLSKIVVGFERIAESFRVLLWNHAKEVGLSPIQIQILIFINYHRASMCGVSHLAKEFNMTKPTISDAVKVLEQKGLITKEDSAFDSRSHVLVLTEDGKSMVSQTESFANPIKAELEKLGSDDLSSIYTAMSQLIFGLNHKGILQVQRTCYNCRHFGGNYCNYHEVGLKTGDIRLDCPEFENSPY
ncbi:MAG: winged helix-turn-helix transcriptional regulator [Cyclobacteriaceae bacterium]